MGRSSFETRTYIIDDLIIVRLKGILTQYETLLQSYHGRVILVRRFTVNTQYKLWNIMEVINFICLNLSFILA